MRKDIRTAWLLLLLSSSCSYGYQLRRELGRRGLSLDTALMYRSLREMESSALITSRWIRSGEGPRRRMYDITAAGEAELSRAAASVREARDEYDAFLASYARHGHEHAASDERDSA